MLTNSLARRRPLILLSILCLFNPFTPTSFASVGTVWSVPATHLPVRPGSLAAHPVPLAGIREAAPGDTVTGTLAGRVVDQAGTPIERALVRVTNLDTGNQRATLTNSEGRYLFTLLPLGRFSIETVRAGYVVI
ncbi:MAG: carboxypeptidase regulatory-like domain-containing protein, partial [Acidobacteria bacterium]|nr:carboxypeptidase regulatory-like domain-containing protein [Acidobacteriota bacterium]